jgi:hypothetical protein
MISTYITIPNDKVQEESSFTATVYFRDVDTATVPTTARYRIDDRTTGDAIRAWTDLTPAASIEISITPDDNKIVSSSRRSERRQITVETNTGLDTQTRERAFWTVNSIDEF